MSTQSAPSLSATQAPGSPARQNRLKIVGHVLDFEKARQSQRQFATKQGLARTTLQNWLHCKADLDASPAVVAFFESPEGVAFLHRQLVAAHLVFGQMGACGLRLMCLFLKMAQLRPFVASSLGSQHKVARAIEQQILVYESEQRAALGAQMTPKTISVGEDETFHPDICLVALEPVSNFLLVERYAERRDAATWSKALTEGLEGLPVKVNQVVSDEAKGLVRHACVELNAHHSPDLFHVQYGLDPIWWTVPKAPESAVGVRDVQEG